MVNDVVKPPSKFGRRLLQNNLEGRETSKIDVEAGGFLNHKAKSKIDGNGQAILKCELYGPIGYDWMFQILGGRNTENRRGTYSPNHETIERNGKSNSSRIGIRGAQSGSCLGLVM